MQQDNLAKECYRRLFDISKTEAELIASDELDAVLGLQDQKAKLRQLIDEAQVTTLPLTEQIELRRFAEKILEQDQKNAIQLKRQHDDVAERVKEAGRLHEWAKGVARTFEEPSGRLHDSVS